MRSLTDWAERRVKREPGSLLNALLATLWTMIGTPLIWLLITPLFTPLVSKAWLFGLASALALSMIGYKVTSRLIARWLR